MLTAARQLRRRELFLIVFLERRTKLRDQGGSVDRQSFDVYHRSINKVFERYRKVSVPAITSASLGGLAGASLMMGIPLTSPGGAPCTNAETVDSCDMTSIKSNPE